MTGVERLLLSTFEKLPPEMVAWLVTAVPVKLASIVALNFMVTVLPAGSVPTVTLTVSPFIVAAVARLLAVALVVSTL